MNPKVYIETSVISYLAAKPSRDLIVAAHQQITIDWWETALPRYDAFVSPIVLDEISRGDVNAVQTRLEKVSAFPVLEILPEIQKLADTYFSELDIPEKARANSYHLAITAWHGIDFLVSWNCTHIVNGRIKMLIEEINAGQGIRTPIICTPEELMEG
ncbi:MAG: type II toxin-antitoxin system VapC family toxin [Nitrospirae bacterium]|nr:type II toxin-antitoxin system VapC family toxin [Nitrospirota bacterium]